RGVDEAPQPRHDQLGGPAVVADVDAQHDLVEPGVNGQGGATGVGAEQIGAEQLLETALAVVRGHGAERAVDVQQVAAGAGLEVHVDGAVDAQARATVFVQTQLGYVHRGGDGLDHFFAVHGIP